MKEKLRKQRTNLPTKASEALKRFRQNQQRKTDRNNRWQWKLFKWDLFALPLNCEEYAPAGHTAGVITFADLVQQPDRLILLTGAPGSAKTTACRRLMVKPPPEAVPVNISKLESLTRGSVLNFLLENLD